MELQGSVIGDLMLKVEDAWAQAEVAERAPGRAGRARLGACDPEHAGPDMPPKLCGPRSTSPSTAWGSAGDGGLLAATRRRGG